MLNYIMNFVLGIFNQSKCNIQEVTIFNYYNHEIDTVLQQLEDEDSEQSLLEFCDENGLKIDVLDGLYISSLVVYLLQVYSMFSICTDGQ